MPRTEVRHGYTTDADGEAISRVIEGCLRHGALPSETGSLLRSSDQRDYEHAEGTRIGLVAKWQATVWPVPMTCRVDST